MKKVLLAFTASSLFLSGCAMVAAPVNGAIFTDVKGPINVGSGFTSSKTGQACATSILGAFAQGDASIDTAKQNGGIKEVTTIDHHSTSILGLYSEFCTIVKGN
jgi:hypothetical protein